MHHDLGGHRVKMSVLFGFKRVWAIQLVGWAMAIKKKKKKLSKRQINMKKWTRIYYGMAVRVPERYQEKKK
jgi:hypothetical protein